MNNPWVYLPDHIPYILPNDKEIIDNYNKKVEKYGDDYKIEDKQLPGPYLGNPKEAPIVILSLNPGYNEDDTKLHEKKEFYEPLKQNLLHKSIDKHPFYYLSPFCQKENCGGYRYWYPRLKDIIKEVAKTKHWSEEDALRRIAQKVSVIEWLPYHSRYFHYLKNLEELESHKYSVELAKEAMKDQQKIIVVQRAYSRWECELGSLSVPNVITKIGKQCRTWYLTKDMLGANNFDRICKKIMAS